MIKQNDVKHPSYLYWVGYICRGYNFIYLKKKDTLIERLKQSQSLLFKDNTDSIEFKLALANWAYPGRTRLIEFDPYVFGDPPLFFSWFGWKNTYILNLIESDMKKEYC
jgi:hypothetical protein